MSLHEMPAQPVAKRHRPLDVDSCAAGERAERRARERFVRNIGDERAVILRQNRQADAVHRQTLAARERRLIGRAQPQPRARFEAARTSR